MAARRDQGAFSAPYLKSIELLASRVEDAGAHPFNLPALTCPDFRIDFTAPVTVLVGPNGSGKSTVIEAIAALCGFARNGGDRSYAIGDQGRNPLAEALRAAWLPKVTTGFFTRAEGFSAFIGQVDDLARDEPAFRSVFGGRCGAERSHGEGYLELFRTRLSRRGVYIFDEPEAALSPVRQIEFLRIVRSAELRGDAQFIIATHSPLLMAYPGATLLHLTDEGLLERPFQLSEHFRTLREFYLDPAAFMHAILPE